MVGVLTGGVGGGVRESNGEKCSITVTEQQKSMRLWVIEARL